MHIRTLSSLAVLLVGLTALGCSAGDDDTLVIEEASPEQPAMEEQMDHGAMDETIGDDAMTDTAAVDTAMAEADAEMAEEEGAAVEE